MVVMALVCMIHNILKIKKCNKIFLIFSLPSVIKGKKRLIVNLKNNHVAEALIKTLVTHVTDCVSGYKHDSSQMNTW